MAVEQNRRFPTTSWTLVCDATNPVSPTRRVSLGALARAYRPAIERYVRCRWRTSVEDAEEISQQFFAALLRRTEDPNVVQPNTPLDATGGRFRAYVRTAVDNFLRMRHRSASSASQPDSIAGAEHEAIEPLDAEAILLREWARQVFTDAIHELEAEYLANGREDQFRVFALHDVDRPADLDVSHRGLATSFGTTPGKINNMLYRARTRLRALILRRVRDTTCSERDAIAELRMVLECHHPN